MSQDRDDFPQGSEVVTNGTEGESTPATGETAEDREASFSRRALLHAGWTVPVILTVAPPRAFAQSPGGQHGDSTVHTDATVHTDTGTGG